MRLIIPLRRDEFARLAKLAKAERRNPQEQAAYLIAQALIARQGGEEQAGQPQREAVSA